MKISSILILALAAGSLAAQEAPPRVDARFQVFVETAQPTSINLGGGLSARPGELTGVGFRFMGEIAQAPNFYYELGGMLDATSYFSISNAGVLDLTHTKFTDSYWSLGAAYIAKPSERLSLGAHLEARGEYLRIQGLAVVGGTDYQLDQETTYLRPWVRGSADYTFAGVGRDVHPFIGVEGAFALLRTSQTQEPSYPAVDDRTVKALAPKYSGAVYAGLRF